MLVYVIILGIVVAIFFLTPYSGVWGQSLHLYFTLMFPRAHWYKPNWLFPKISVKEYLITSGGRRMNPDIYRPKDSQRRPGIIIYAPLSEEGKQNPRVINFMQGLARLGFVVMVPFWSHRQIGTIEMTDATDLKYAADWFARQPGVDPKRIGLVAVSYGVGPALIAAQDTTFAKKIRSIAAVSGYTDMRSAAQFAITGSYRYKNITGQERPEKYAHYISYLSMAHWVAQKKDRKVFLAIADRIEQDKPIEWQHAHRSLSLDGQAVLDFLRSRNEKEFTTNYLALPQRIKNRLDALSPLPNIGFIKTPVYLLHSTYDHLVPYTESIKCFDALPNQTQHTLTLVNAFDHTIPVRATPKNIWHIYIPNAWRILRYIHHVLSI